MTRAQEIIGYVKNRRGEAGAFRKRHLGQEEARVEGQCMQSVLVANQFNGQRWHSNEALGRPGQVYPGHSVAVVPTRRDAGLIVDFTNVKNIIIGSVDSMNDNTQTEQALKRATGFKGWRKKR